ncbi:hypothetical protein [Microbacterium elymi]|uniref:hypothetical protein n=1 Tax=Microbacterium elymi TaxID=2909587 RepID=UPI00338F3D5E
MDGKTAQWYARSRKTTSDWDRMKRQRQAAGGDPEAVHPGDRAQPVRRHREGGGAPGQDRHPVLDAGVLHRPRDQGEGAQGHDDRADARPAGRPDRAGRRVRAYPGA